MKVFILIVLFPSEPMPTQIAAFDDMADCQEVAYMFWENSDTIQAYCIQED